MPFQYPDCNTVVVTTKPADRDYSLHPITLQELVNDFEVGKKYIDDEKTDDSRPSTSTSTSSSTIEIPESKIKEKPSLAELRENLEIQQSNVTPEEVHYIYNYRNKSSNECDSVLSRLSIRLLLALHAAHTSDTTVLEQDKSFEQDLADAFSIDLWTLKHEKDLVIDLCMFVIAEAIRDWETTPKPSQSLFNNELQQNPTEDDRQEGMVSQQEDNVSK